MAEMYGVETKQINRAVKRNEDRFPEKFMFQLTEKEWDFLRYQFGTLKLEETSMPQNKTLENNRGKHRKYLPYAFTEQGVAMLSAVLRSETAVKVSLQIMDAFVEMRKVIMNNALIIERLDKMELKQLEADHQFEQIFPVIEYRYNWGGNYATIIVTDPNGYVFEMKKDIDTRKDSKDKPLPLTPFLALKELQQFNSGLEYELKLENERFGKTITKLRREIESLKEALINK